MPDINLNAQMEKENQHLRKLVCLQNRLIRGQESEIQHLYKHTNELYDLIRRALAREDYLLQHFTPPDEKSLHIVQKL